MKKNLIIITALVGIMVVAGYALYLILTIKNDGTDPKTNPEALRGSTEEKSKEGSEEKGESINP